MNFLNLFRRNRATRILNDDSDAPGINVQVIPVIKDILPVSVDFTMVIKDSEYDTWYTGGFKWEITLRSETPTEEDYKTKIARKDGKYNIFEDSLTPDTPYILWYRWKSSSVNGIETRSFNFETKK